MKLAYSKTLFAQNIGFNYLNEKEPFYVLPQKP